ncbi:hypothetical protein [Kutzneria buriramensis]|uniref:Uncharacterized protein n=1 Tax=Kutzneria buriramensis TaxID=1045776 RepID=A0A3E0I537_9PSEU|nr:hypothetical protein [Kutzneria buriramensis]REH53843.1 hypothetical protein BCF44_10264 [Kutzneria buriramensis]
MRLRDERVLAELCALLPPAQVEMVWDYAGHAEVELAFETAVDYLSGAHLPIDAGLRARVRDACSYSERVRDALRFCPDSSQPLWRIVEDTWDGLEIEERLPDRTDAAWLACNRCPEVLFRFDSVAASMGKVPYRCGVLAENGEITEFTDAVDALDHLERCWS